MKTVNIDLNEMEPKKTTNEDSLSLTQQSDMQTEPDQRSDIRISMVSNKTS